MCKAEEQIVEEIRLAKKRKRPSVYVITVTGGIVQIRAADLIGQYDTHTQQYDKRHIANGNGSR